MAKLQWIADSGHGWLEVPTPAVIEAGITPSRYSYISDDRLMTYLEEDCDARTYLWDVGSDDEYIPETYIDGDCWVRDLEHCDEYIWEALRRLNSAKQC